MRERDVRLLTYIREGHTFSEAARYFGLTRQRVQQIASREAVPTTRPPVVKDRILALYYGGGIKRAVDIATALGCNASYVRDVLAQDRKAQPWQKDIPAGISLMEA
jgi:hypothetical protein